MKFFLKKYNIFALAFLFLVTCSDDNKPTEPEPVAPSANFTFTPSSGYAPLTVQFTSTSTGDITTYAWDFQNNLTTESSQRNPEYTYTDPGVYSIRLTVQGPGGNDTKIQENSITVLDVSAPVIEDISQQTNEDIALQITLSGNDPQDFELTYSLTEDPQNGSAEINGSTLIYTPNDNWNGTETFKYIANNQYLDSNEATITITVNAVDDEPNTLDVSAETDEDTPISFTLNANEVDGDSYTFGILSNPSNGTIALSGNNVLYTPDTDWNGVDTFTFEATDERMAFENKIILNVGTATITVNAINDVPVADNISVSLVENTALLISFSASDIENDNLSFSIVSQPSNGGLGAVAGSQVLYTPNSDFNGSDFFIYQANDGTDNSNTAIVSITISPANTAPEANNQSLTTNEDTSATLNLDATDINEDTLSYVLVENPSNGTVTISGSSATYTPNVNWNGTETFSWKANDGLLDSNTATVSVVVNAINDAPSANDITTSYDTRTAASVNITLSATDPEDDSLTYAIVSDVTNGSTSISGAVVTYTASTDFEGTDTFTFKVNDGSVDSNTATVTITVDAEDTPTTNDVSASTDEDTAVDITLDGSDGDSGDTLTYSIVSDVSNGTTSLSGSTVTYTPDDDWNGTDTFTYNMNDGDEDSNTSTVTITVAAVNDAPTTSPLSTSANEDTATNITLLVGDDDGDTLTYSVVSNPSNGSLGNISEAEVTYTPSLNFNGTDTFSFKANDGTVDSNTSTVTITVAAVNDVPVANDVSGSTNENRSIQLSITLDATDVDGDDLTYSIVSDVSNGTTSISGSTLTYTPDTNWNGTDTFTYKANDGLLDSNTASGTITVSEVNDAPTTEDVSASTNEDTNVDITLNGSDVEGSNLTFSIVSDVSNGSTSLSGSTVSYSPDLNWNGTETFTYKANDGTDDSNTSTVTITVDSVNDAPITSDKGASTNEDTAVTTTLSVVDVDTIQGMTRSIVSNPSNGSVVLSGSGNQTATYTPDANWNGTDTFTWKANDGTDDSNTSTVTITVAAVNDTPTISDDTATLNEDATVDVTLSGSDIEGDTLTFSVSTNPSNGTLVLSGTNNEVATYTPNTNYNGSDSFIFTANDGTVDSDSATIFLTVNAVNDAPTAEDITVSTNENRMMQLSITLDGSDVDGDNLTYQIVESVSNGTLTDPSAGDQVTYTPNSDWNGTETFTYKANDGSLDSNTATVTITVSEVNDTPVSTDVSASTNEDTEVAIQLEASDVDGDTLTYSIITNPTSGTVGVSGATAVYTPDSNYNGTDTFTFKANDGTDDSNTSTVTITVAAVNDLPTTDDQTASTDEDNAVDITLTSTDPDTGDTITYSIVSDVSNGSTSLSGSTVTYTPTANYNGTDTFTFKANDGTGDSNTSTVTVTIAAVDDIPVVDAQTLSTNEDTAVSVTLTATDVEGDTIEFAIDTAPSNGTLNPNTASWFDGQFDYTPNQDYNGTDTILVKAKANGQQSVSVNITINIAAVNDAPTTSAVSASTNEDTSKSITLVAADVEGSTLTYSIVSDPSNGSLGFGSNTNPGVNYTPSANFNGTDTFTYKVNDGTVDSNTSTVTITVAAVNDAPVTSDQTASTDEDTAVDITLSSTDVEGDSVTYSIVSDVSNGSTSLSGSTVTYTPTADYNGTDTFSFEASDGSAPSNTSTVTITVAAVNDAPVAQNVTGSTNENRMSQLGITLVATDVDGDDLTYSIVSTNDGSVTVSGSTATYTPDDDWNGTDTFTYKANDGTVDSNTATATITVAAVNDAPVTSDQTASTDEDNAVDITLTSTDPDTGDTITYSIVSDVSNGSTSLSGSTVTYTPTANYNGTDTFTFKANDGTDDSNTSTVTITVAAVNDAPVASAVSASTNEDTFKGITLSATDAEGSSLTYSIVSNPSNGSLSSVFLTGVTYTPSANFNGTDTFTYKANDGTADSNTATVTVTVAPTNDLPTTSDQTASTNEDTDVDITLESTDIDTGDTITYSIVSDVSNGSTSLSGSTVTYTPTADWSGTDTFTFKANDGTGDSNTSTVTITVAAVNDGPTSSDEGIQTSEDTAIRTGFSSTDVEGDTITLYEIVSQPSNGTASIDMSNNEPGLYTPDANWNGTDSFTYRATDGTTWGNTATATVTVSAVNDLPTTSDATATTDEDATTFDITLSSSATDVDGDGLTYSIVGNPSNGVLGSFTNSVIRYTPNSNFSGTDTFTYKANDGTGDSNTSTVTVTVNETENDYAYAFNGYLGDGQSTSISQHAVLNYGEIDNNLGEAGDALTMMVWIYPNADPNRTVIMDVSNYGNSGTPRYGRVSVGGSPGDAANSGFYDTYMQSDQGGNWSGTTSVIPTMNAWSHIAVVVNPTDTSYRLYVNGVEVYTRTDFDVTHTFNGTRNWQLGSISTAEAYHSFTGYMDDFAIWSSALTEAQIQSIYNSGNGGVDPRDVSSNTIEFLANFEYGNNGNETTDVVNGRTASQSSRVAQTTATPY